MVVETLLVEGVLALHHHDEKASFDLSVAQIATDGGETNIPQTCIDALLVACQVQAIVLIHHFHCSGLRRRSIASGCEEPVCTELGTC